MITGKRQNRRVTRGAAMIESMMAMMIILLILFGILQIFQLSLTQIFTDYAAFRGARSTAVGFTDYLANREARIQAIPASGEMVHPRHSTSFSTPYEQFLFEKSAIEYYMTGQQYLCYDYWTCNNDDPLHNDYHCPYYGKRFSEASPDCSCTCETCCGNKPYIQQDNAISSQKVHTMFTFMKYPLNIPMHDVFVPGKQLHIGYRNDNNAKIYHGDETRYPGSAFLANYADSFLEQQ